MMLPCPLQDRPDTCRPPRPARARPVHSATSTALLPRQSALLRDLRGQLQSSRTVQHAGLSLTVQALPPAFPSATDTQKTYCGATRPHTSTAEAKSPTLLTGRC